MNLYLLSAELPHIICICSNSLIQVCIQHEFLVLPYTILGTRKGKIEPLHWKSSHLAPLCHLSLYLIVTNVFVFPASWKLPILKNPCSCINPFYQCSYLPKSNSEIIPTVFYWAHALLTCYSENEGILEVGGILKLSPISSSHIQED